MYTIHEMDWGGSYIQNYQIVPTFEHVLTRIKGKLNTWEWKCKRGIGQYPRRIIKIVRINNIIWW